GKITISAINKLEGWLWDVAVIGFGARRQTNLVHYYIRYRHNGSQIVRSIGRHGALTPDTARAKAKQLLGTVAGGVDPFARALAGEGFATAIERYLDRSALRSNPPPCVRPNAICAMLRYLFTAFAWSRSTGAKWLRYLAVSKPTLAQSLAIAPVALCRASSLGASARA